MRRNFGILLATIVIMMSAGCGVFPQLNVGRQVTKQLLNQNTEIAPDTSTLTETPEPTNTPTQVPTITEMPTSTPTITPTITPTPWNVDLFASDQFRPWVEGVHYISDTCQYLTARWGENKSSPGTVVVPIMFHSITQPGRVITDNTSISMETFDAFMAYAKLLGYETITTEQLITFLDSNAEIPERSMILILDDRRPGVARAFLPYLDENFWTLTLAWISVPNSDAEWDEIEELAEAGRYDVQSHGYRHEYIQDFTPEEVIHDELYRSMAVLEEHFGTEPSAIIWPGGNFTQKSVDIAQEAGYSIGFTAYSRGPLLFNMIPLGEEERQIDQPLYVLPRFWSTAAFSALDDGVSFSESASVFADQQREAELFWMELYCK